MKERRISIREKIHDAIGKLFEVPTYEQLVEDFPHDPSCSGQGNLIKGVRIIHGGPVGVFGIDVISEFPTLSCDECGVMRDNV